MASSLSGRVRRHAGTNTPLLSFRARCAGARMLPRKTPSRTADATRTAPDTQTTSAETPRRASSPTSCSTRNRPRRLVTRHRPLPRRLVALSSLHPQAQICLQPLPWGGIVLHLLLHFHLHLLLHLLHLPCNPNLLHPNRHLNQHR